MDQNRSKSARNRSKSIQDRRKSGPNRSKAVQERQKIDKGRPRTLQEAPKRAKKGPKPKKIHQVAKTIPRIEGVGGYAEPRRRGKGRQAPRVRRSSAVYEALSRTLRSRRKRRVRRIEDADARPPHLRRGACVWVAQSVCFCFRKDSAKILPRL